MSMIQRVRLLLLAVLLPTLLGSLLLHTTTLHEALREQQQQRNQDAASMLALALSQQRGDLALAALAVSAQFDTGHYRSIVLRGSDGAVLIERRDGPPPAPDWFSRHWPIEAGDGVAQVSAGWQPLGQVEVAAQTAWAQAALWQAVQRSLLLMLGLTALLALGAGAALRAWQRPLEVAAAQARSLEEGRFVIATEPRMPELRRLSAAMNSLVRRLREQFAAQADEVERLRRQAHLDSVTGLPHRRHVLALLDGVLLAPARATLLLLRLGDLAAMNARLGHAGADRLLAALAEVLQRYPARVPGAFAGRLNGSDFLLYLPRAGLADETARSLQGALRAALHRIDPEAGLAIGGVEGLLEAPAARPLALADQALACAEAEGAFGIHVATTTAFDGLPEGGLAWRTQLSAALAAGRVQLAEHPVHDAAGRLLRRVCPLRLTLQPGGAVEPATRWLPMAARHRLTAMVDLAAAELALAAIARDGLPRCVHVAAASLATPGFAGDLRARLAAAPQAASALSIELPEQAALADAAPLVEAAMQWRRAGARVGLGHAGDALQRLPALPQLGLDFVTIDATHLRCLHADARLQDFARALATLVRPLGLELVAAGIDDEADLAMLWALGFDAATGPAVR